MRADGNEFFQRQRLPVVHAAPLAGEGVRAVLLPAADLLRQAVVKADLVAILPARDAAAIGFDRGQAGGDVEVF